MATARTCPNCNAEIEEGSQFCPNCGHQLVAEAARSGSEVPVSPRAGTMSASDERTWTMFTHLSAFAGVVVPFGNFIGPLVVWLLKKQDSDLVDLHGKESLNFQISMLIYVIASFVLAFVIIGIPMLIALGIFWLVMVIRAAIRASNGQDPGYKLVIRFLK